MKEIYKVDTHDHSLSEKKVLNTVRHHAVYSIINVVNT